MTANGIVDQSDRVQQSLSELTYRTYQIDEQVQSLQAFRHYFFFLRLSS